MKHSRNYKEVYKMDTYEVRITDIAFNHLKGIRNYIENELYSPNTAKNLFNNLYNGIKSLSVFPERHKTIDEQPWGSFGVRKCIVKNYYIYFYVDKDKKLVQIMGVIYSKQNQESVLEKL